LALASHEWVRIGVAHAEEEETLKGFLCFDSYFGVGLKLGYFAFRTPLLIFSTSCLLGLGSWV